jgi:hypothetical protein
MEPYITDEINKGHTVYAKSQWTDPEPDTFYMSVEAANPRGPKFVVMSGCATWLSLKQAREVYETLGRYIAFMERRTRTRKERAEARAKEEGK